MYVKMSTQIFIVALTIFRNKVGEDGTGVSYPRGFYNTSESVMLVPKGRAKSKEVNIQRKKIPREVREVF